MPPNPTRNPSRCAPHGRIPREQRQFSQEGRQHPNDGMVMAQLTAEAREPAKGQVAHGTSQNTKAEHPIGPATTVRKALPTPEPRNKHNV